MQTVIVLIIVLLAVVYLIYRSYRIGQAARKGITGCAFCSNGKSCCKARKHNTQNQRLTPLKPGHRE